MTSTIQKLLFFAVLLFIVFIHFFYLEPGVDAGIHMYGSFLITKGFLPYQNLWNNKPPLIYIIGLFGFLVKSNPFLGVRIAELLVFACNLILIDKIVKRAKLGEPLIYLLGFSAIYLVSWDQGFLTETFTIPLSLAALYFFILKVRYYELICALFLTLSYLLKQNAQVFVTGIMLVDIFSQSRQKNKAKKIIKYFAALLFFSLVAYLLLRMLAIWGEFLDQVFVYNFKYRDHTSFYTLIINHLRHNSFLSIKGISAVLFFNFCMLITLWKYLKMKQRGFVFELRHWLLVNLILIYIGSYFFVYISGKTYPHYYMILIVPATFILGHYITDTKMGKIALLLLLIAGFVSNISPISFNNIMKQNRKELVSFLRKNTPNHEFIHVAGFGNQYIYVMTDRLSNTKFVLPLFEKEGYTKEYKNILTNDFIQHPPLFIIVNKNNYKQLEPNNFYTQLIMKVMEQYRIVFENGLYGVYKR